MADRYVRRRHITKEEHFKSNQPNQDSSYNINKSRGFILQCPVLQCDLGEEEVEKE